MHTTTHRHRPTTAFTIARDPGVEMVKWAMMGFFALITTAVFLLTSPAWAGDGGKDAPKPPPRQTAIAATADCDAPRRSDCLFGELSPRGYVITLPPAGEVMEDFATDDGRRIVVTSRGGGEFDVDVYVPPLWGDVPRR